MSEKQYHFEQRGSTAGPVLASELLAQGVRHETLVWTAGMPEWIAAGAVGELESLFATPPPLPATPGPPPLPTVSAVPPVEVPVVARRHPFDTMGYSLPLLGRFRDDEQVWALESEELVAQFALNADLRRLQSDGYTGTTNYQFILLDAAQQPLLSFHKPKASLLNPLKAPELHVYNARNERLGICRRGNGFTLLRVEDTNGQFVMEVKLAALGSRELVVQSSTLVVAHSRRSHPPSWVKLFVIHKHDRCEVTFEPAATTMHKALGIAAIIAVHLFVPQLQ